MRRHLLILTAIAVLAASASSTAVAVSPPSGSAGASSSSTVTAATAAKKKALRKCRKINNSVRRKACVKRVIRKYAEPSTSPDLPPAAVIDVRDKYFSPDVVNISSGDSILWVWNTANKDAHNVNLASGPSGVSRTEFGTPSSPSVGFTFKRTFTVPGTYQFVCSIHYLMKMQVEVSK